MSRRINRSTVPTLAVGEAVRFPSGNGFGGLSFTEINSSTDLVPSDAVR
jgi:hypothetical protein